MIFEHIILTDNEKEFIDYGYLLRIDNINDLIHYFKNERIKHVDKSIDDMLGSVLDVPQHPTNILTHFAYQTVKLPISEKIDIKKLKKAFYGLKVIISKHFLDAVELLEKGYILYFKHNGCYLVKTNDMNIKNFYKTDKYIWKQINPKIKVFKWIGGKHYYAKIGNIDVVDDKGRQKWNTKTMAYKQAEIMLKKLAIDNN